MKSNIGKLSLLVVLVSFISLSAMAYDVIFTFSGIVTGVSSYYEGNPTTETPPSSPFSVGDIAQWNLSYNMDLLPGAGNTSTEATYANAYYPAKDIFLGASLDGIQVNGYPLLLFVNNDSINSISTQAYIGIINEGVLGITLNDSTGTALGGSDALPTSLSISDWDSSAFSFVTPASSQTQMWQYVATGVLLVPQVSISVVFVPEPSTLALDGLGGFVVMLIVRRRKYSARLNCGALAGGRAHYME
jgi:hypothetical protein